MPRIAAALLASVLVAPPLTAQRGTDEARLVVGVAGGWIGGLHLWTVNGQPVIDPLTDPPTIDTVDVGRNFRSGATFAVQVTYFGSDHLGVTGEFTSLGLGMIDSCRPSSDPCSVEDQRETSASASMIGGGIIYRLSGRTALQPYLRALAGIATVANNPVALSFPYINAGLAYGGGNVAVWPDQDWSEQRLACVLGIGVSTAPSRGFQFRVEARDTWVGLSTVTGPTDSPGGGTLPPRKSTWLGFPSVMIGLDLVLTKSRGLRY